MAAGTDVAQSEVPYQASFRLIEQDRHLGSGAILNVRFIITQASFIWKLMRTYPGQPLSELARIRLGQVELKSKIDDRFYTIYSHTYHPEFDFEAARNDVALLRTREYIDFNRFVQPIELLSGPIPEGSLVSYTDWGAEKVEGAEGHPCFGVCDVNYYHFRILPHRMTIKKSCKNWTLGRFRTISVRSC